jgi:hypothetical protein
VKTVGEIVQDTRRLVYGSMNDQINLLEKDYAADDDRLVFKLDIQGVTPGMVLSHGMNVWYVTEVTPTTKTVYVVPRYDGSFALPVKAGEVVMLRPRATDWMLFSEVKRSITGMSSRVNGLYRTGKESMAAQVGYWGHYTLLATDIDSIVAVYVRQPWGDRGLKQLQDRQWRWNHNDNELRILDPEVSWAPEVEVIYRAPFKEPQDLWWDVVSQCGLSPSMTDIPALGAASALLLTTEGRRGQTAAQGDPRRAEEVSPGSNSSAAREMRRRYEDRIADEAARLVNANPYMQSI